MQRDDGARQRHFRLDLTREGDRSKLGINTSTQSAIEREKQGLEYLKRIGELQTCTYTSPPKSTTEQKHRSNQRRTTYRN